MDVTEDIDLLKRYFKNKASGGALTLNGEDVLAAFARLVASLETLAHNIEACRDHYLWVRKHYIAARQEFDSKPREKNWFTFLRWEAEFDRAKERLDNAYALGQGQPLQGGGKRIYADDDKGGRGM